MSNLGRQTGWRGVRGDARVRGGTPGWVLLPVLLFLAAPALRAADYHVDPVNGSDAAGDGSSGRPWRSLTHALATIPPAAPGSPHHKLLGRAGTYDADGSGEVFPILMRPDVDVIGAGFGMSLIRGSLSETLVSFPGGLWFTPATRLEGFTLAYGAIGVQMAATAPSEVSCPTVENCVFLANQVAGISGTSLATASLLPPIHRCIFLANISGLVFTAAGGVVGPNVTRSLFSANLGSGAFFTGAGTLAPSFTACIVSQSGNDGLHFLAGPGGSAEATVENCTVVGSNGRGIRVGGNAAGTAVLNTIAYFNGTADLDGLAAGQATFCDFGTASGHGTPPAAGSQGNISADPLFVAYPVDLRLQPGSPCLDAGSSAPGLTINEDFDGDARIVDGNGDSVPEVDIGADEFTLLRFGWLPKIGTTLPILLAIPQNNASLPYQMAASTASTPGIAIPGDPTRTIPLAWSDLLTASVDPNSSIFPGFQGTTSPSGTAVGWIVIPNDPGLAGAEFWVAAATGRAGAPGNVQTVSNPLRVMLR